MPEPFVQDPSYQLLLLRSAAVGAVAAGGTAAFLAAEHTLHHLIWSGAETSDQAFATPLWAVGIILLGALVVGLSRRWTRIDPPDPNFLDEMVHGRTPLRHAMQLTGIGLASLVGGASVGPEAPAATLGAGIGTAMAERSTSDASETADLTFAGISGVFGALLTFPFAAPVIALELQHDERFGSYARLLPGLVAAVVALAIMYPLIGTPFLRIYDLGPADLRSVHLLLGAGLGLVGTLLGLCCAVAIGVVGQLAERLPGPIWRAGVAGAVIAAAAIAMPLTMFSGRQELTVVLGGTVATGLLLATVAGKIVTFAVSMRLGYYGGALFPLLFIGATAGYLVHVAVPALPPALVVPTTAAATTVALVPLPLAVLVLVTLMFGLPVELSAVPAVAVVVAYVLVHGTGILTAMARRTARAPTEPTAP